jgi:hypothetical protein
MGSGKTFLVTILLVVVVVAGSMVLGLNGSSMNSNCSLTLTNWVVWTADYNPQIPGQSDTPQFPTLRGFPELEARIGIEQPKSTLFAATEVQARALAKVSSDALHECGILEKGGANISTIAQS